MTMHGVGQGSGAWRLRQHGIHMAIASNRPLASVAAMIGPQIGATDAAGRGWPRRQPNRSPAFFFWVVVDASDDRPSDRRNRWSLAAMVVEDRRWTRQQPSRSPIGATDAAGRRGSQLDTVAAEDQRWTRRPPSRSPTSAAGGPAGYVKSLGGFLLFVRSEESIPRRSWRRFDLTWGWRCVRSWSYF